MNVHVILCELFKHLNIITDIFTRILWMDNTNIHIYKGLFPLVSFPGRLEAVYCIEWMDACVASKTGLMSSVQHLWGFEETTNDRLSGIWWVQLKEEETSPDLCMNEPMVCPHRLIFVRRTLRLYPNPGQYWVSKEDINPAWIRIHLKSLSLMVNHMILPVWYWTFTWCLLFSVFACTL